jgi:nicotinamide-nucleotide amidase
MSKDHNVLTDCQKPLQKPLELIKNICAEQHLTIAVAESVTAGCLQLLLSTAQEAGEFFQGGITAYNCAQKAIHLHIDPVFATNCNGVDQRIAVDMARHACVMFRSQVGIGVTGYATKVPEQNIHVLFAYLAITKNGEVMYQGKLSPTSDGINAQWEYAAQTIDILSAALKEAS